MTLDLVSLGDLVDIRTGKLKPTPVSSRPEWCLSLDFRAWQRRTFRVLISEWANDLDRGVVSRRRSMENLNRQWATTAGN